MIVESDIRGTEMMDIAVFVVSPGKMNKWITTLLIRKDGRKH